MSSAVKSDPLGKGMNLNIVGARVPYTFVYLMWVIITGQALYFALLQSIKEAGLSPIQTQWITVVAIIVTCSVVLFYWNWFSHLENS